MLWDGLSLDVDSGETLVVRGPSGSGKTLLLRALAGLDPLERGSLSLHGAGPEVMGWTLWRRRVLFVAQDPPIHPGTPREFWEQVQSLAVQTFREHDDPTTIGVTWGLPEVSWGQPWSGLSGGERQRAALAIALATRPDILLLDEPTSALDPDATSAVEASLRGQTLLWVTHDLTQSKRIADSFIAIDSGQ